MGVQVLQPVAAVDRKYYYATSGHNVFHPAPMPTGRHLAAAAVCDGKAYVFGGRSGTSSSYTYHNKNECYDPATDTWLSMASFSTVSRHSLTAVELDGKIHVLGGYNNSENVTSFHDQYDPVSNSYVAKNNHFAAAHAAVALNGKMYRLGGVDSGKNVVDWCYEYDPVSNTWTERMHMPTARSYLGAVVVDGLIYAICGSNNNKVEVYNPATNTWSSKPDSPYSVSRAHAEFIDGYVYVYNKSNSGMYRYDPSTDSWMQTASDPVGSAADGTPFKLNDKFYVAGGGSSVQTLRYYDPKRDPEVYGQLNRGAIEVMRIDYAPVFVRFTTYPTNTHVFYGGDGTRYTSLANITSTSQFVLLVPPVIIRAGHPWTIGPTNDAFGIIIF